MAGDSWSRDNIVVEVGEGFWFGLPDARSPSSSLIVSRLSTDDFRRNQQRHAWAGEPSESLGFANFRRQP